MKTIVKGPVNSEPTLVELENRELSRVAAREGFVLLKNNGVLPIKEKEIALYGSGARMTVKGGRGSGEVRNRYSVSIEEGLKNAGFRILTDRWLDGFDRFYADTYEAYRVEMEKRVEGLRDFGAIQRAMIPFDHPSGMNIDRDDLAETDTAIYVIARQAGEGHDRRAEKGDYFLTDVEMQGLKFVSDNYKNMVVIVNAGGLIDLSYLDELNVSALVYFTQGGEEGGNALGDLLSGKYNFSGKLTTSWPESFDEVPSAKNYSDASEDKYTQDYNEGIFVGYRYYDTFGVRPKYSFGYGLSYTSFAITFSSLDLEKGRCSVKAEVKNTGAFEGREVVQLYASVPFGSGAEKQRLVAFAKTPLLKPSESCSVDLEFTFRDISVYDEASASWILRGGEYILRLGNSSDSNCVCSVLRLKEDRVLEKCTNICPLQKPLEELQAPEREKENTEGVPSFDLDRFVPESVVHTYDTPEEQIDSLVWKMTDEQLVELVTGPGVSATGLQVQALGSSGNTTGKLYDSLGIPNVILSDGPAGLNLSAWVVQLPNGEVRGALIPENIEAYKRYLFGFNRVIMLSRMAKPEDGTLHYQYATAWPCSQLLAQTFDPDFIEKVGYAVGREMEQYGVTVWLAPGMNIHRNPLCGRTFEYYSEDPLVSGKMAAAIVRGVQRHPGKGMSIKHFVANNCELHRNSSSSNLTEKTLREVYLRGFEIAVKESDPMTVMASYNLVNGLHVVNNYDLLAKVLRNEWGFRNMVMSDWDSMKAEPNDPEVPKTGDVQKAHKAQLDLVCPGREDQKVALLRGLKNGKVKRSDLVRGATRILRLIRANVEVPVKD
ncbi:MAG: glycoside hydrolase family 3 C-terminal domain-containing protein [Sphaerochaetaceae bacterium]|nr:glycoside hydrolase family 3 C-terminal domain-containing protein [Sphaerochaetaceae bacterium]